MKDLQKISIIGMGLLGGSVSLAIRQRNPEATVIGYSHRASTRKKARDLALATEIADDLITAVTDADLVILATPIFTFETYFREMSEALRPGCIVTDVGSTKVLPHEWAAKALAAQAHYVGSHPIAGSEQRGLEYARDDLINQARCILTTTATTHKPSVTALRKFWTDLGCHVVTMPPTDHDRVYANISHLPHLIAAGLVNASQWDDVKFAGKGFLDSTRIASGPATIWTDVLLANSENLAEGIDRVVAELMKLKHAVKARDAKEIEVLLEAARDKRASLVKYKLRKKELL